MIEDHDEWSTGRADAAPASFVDFVFFSAYKTSSHHHTKIPTSGNFPIT